MALPAAWFWKGLCFVFKTYKPPFADRQPAINVCVRTTLAGRRHIVGHGVGAAMQGGAGLRSAPTRPCSACNAEKPRGDYSKRQWSQHSTKGGSCRDCVTVGDASGAAELGALLRLLSWIEEGIVERIFNFSTIPWKEGQILYPIQNQPGVLALLPSPADLEEMPTMDLYCQTSRMPADEMAAEVAALRLPWANPRAERRIGRDVGAARAFILHDIDAGSRNGIRL